MFFFLLSLSLSLSLPLSLTLSLSPYLSLSLFQELGGCFLFFCSVRGRGNGRRNLRCEVAWGVGFYWRERGGYPRRRCGGVGRRQGDVFGEEEDKYVFFFGAQIPMKRRLKITSTSTERQKGSQHLAPVLVIISGNSLVFSRKIITSTGFYRCCAPGASAPVVVKNQSPTYEAKAGHILDGRNRAFQIENR